MNGQTDHTHTANLGPTGRHAVAHLTRLIREGLTPEPDKCGTCLAALAALDTVIAADHLTIEPE